MNWITYKTRGVKPSEELSHYFSSSDESLDNDLLENVQSEPVSNHKHIFRIPERPKKIRQSLVNRKKMASSTPMHQPQKTFHQSLPLSPVEHEDDEVTLTKSRRNSSKISKQSEAPVNVLLDDLSCHLDSDLSETLHIRNTLMAKDQRVPAPSNESQVVQERRGSRRQKKEREYHYNPSTLLIDSQDLLEYTCRDLDKSKSHKSTTSKISIIENRVINDISTSTNGANKENLKSARGRTGQKRNKKSIPGIIADSERRRSKRQKKERVYHYNPSTLLIDSQDLLEYTYKSKRSQSWFKQAMTSQQIDFEVTASNQKSRKCSEIKENTSKPNHKTKKVKGTGNSNRVKRLLVDVAVQTESYLLDALVQSIIKPSKLTINSPIQNKSKMSQSQFKQAMTLQQIDSNVTVNNQTPRISSEIKENTSKPNRKRKKVKDTQSSNRVNNSIVDITVQKDNQPIETQEQSEIEPTNVTINSPIKNGSRGSQSWFKQAMTLQQTDSNVTVINQKSRKSSEIKENTSKPNGKRKKVKDTLNSNRVNNSIVDITVQKDNQPIETQEQSEIEPTNVTINSPIKNGSRGSQSWFKQAMTLQQTDSNVTVINQKPRKSSEIKENTSKPNGKTKKVKGTRSSNTFDNSIVDIAMQKDNQLVQTEEQSKIEPANVTINSPIKNGSRGSQSWFKQAMTLQQTDSNVTVSKQKPRKFSEMKDNTSNPNGKPRKVKGIPTFNRVNNSIVDVTVQKDNQTVEVKNNSPTATWKSTQINHKDLKDTIQGDNLNNSKGQPNPQIYSDSKLRNYFYFPENNKVSKINYCFRDFPINTTGKKESLQIARRCKSSHAGFESGLLEIQPGQAKTKTIAVKFSKIFLVLEGKGLFYVHDSYCIVKCGAEIYVPLGASYSIRNQSQTEKLLLHYIKMYPQGS